MTLAELQRAFLAGLADIEGHDCAALSPSRREGYAVYRNAYRTTLVDALRETFPRTLDYAGENSFRAAATHFLINRPPSSWSLDHLGLGFDAVVGELFAHHPEVAEIAALEWALHKALFAPDIEPLDFEAFASSTASFSDEDWDALRLTFVPHSLLAADYDLRGWWKDSGVSIASLSTPHRAFVWREDEQPVFVLIEESEANALCAMQGGSTFGDICERLAGAKPQGDAVEAAAGMLARWLQRGWISGIGGTLRASPDGS